MPNPPKSNEPLPVKLFHETTHGRILLGDSLGMFREKIEPGAVDLIMTSPPFGLVRKKDYGNADADDYLEWFRPFAAAFHKALKPQGSLVIDIGGSWVSGHLLKSNVIVVVSTGEIGASARGYTNKVMGDTNLYLVLVNGDDLLAIEKNPAAIVDVFRREAVHAMRLKTLEL